MDLPLNAGLPHLFPRLWMNKNRGKAIGSQRENEI